MNMVKKIIAYLTRTRSDDPDEARYEYMTRVILIVMAVIAIIATLLAIPGVVSGKIPMDTLVIFFTMDALYLLGWYFSGKGYWRIGRHIPVLMFFVSAVYGNYVGGMGAPAMLLYVLSITLAAMLFGARAQYAVITLAVFSYLGIAYLHNSGILVAIRSDESAFYNRILIAVTAMLAIGALMRFLVSRLEGALQVSRSRGDELEAANEELEAGNEELQATMEELEAANQAFESANRELVAALGEVEKSEGKYRGLVESINEVIFSTDESGVLTYVSPAIRSIIGYDPADIAGRKFVDFIYPEDLENMVAGFQDVASGNLKPSDYRLTTAAGGARWVRSFSTPVIENGVFSGISGVLTDIHERKLAEREIQSKHEELEKSEARFRTLIESSPVPIFLAMKGDFLYVNDAFRGMVRQDLSENLIGKSLLDFVAPEDRDRIADYIAKRSGGDDAPLSYEAMGVRTDGTRFPYEINIATVDFEEGPATLAFMLDITQRKQAEEQVRALNVELERKVMERTHQLSVANENLSLSNRDLQETIEKLNEARFQLVQTEKLTALGQLAAGIAHEMNTPLGAIMSSNRTLIDILHKGIPGLSKLIAGMTENQIKCFDALMSDGLESAGNIEYMADRAEKNRIADILRQADIRDWKALADTIIDLGIADCVENHLEILKSDKRDRILQGVSNIIALRRLGEIIVISAEKMAHVVEALKSYLRQDDPGVLAPVDIPAEIEMILTLYRNKMKHGIAVTKTFNARNTVIGDRNSLNQVWMNLINNALQAMNFQGTLEILTEMKEDRFVVSFIDSGEGISPEIRDRIFEPFFTTKKHGEGIGLGLEICRKIVDKQGGTIDFESVPGRTAFNVRLRAGEKPE